MYSFADRLTPDTYHALARAVYAEMALAGVTAVGESTTCTTPPADAHADPNAMGEALVAAADEAGIRITLLDTAYVSSGFGQPPNPHQRRFSDGSAEAWAERSLHFSRTVITHGSVRPSTPYGPCPPDSWRR